MVLLADHFGTPGAAFSFQLRPLCKEYMTRGQTKRDNAADRVTRVDTSGAAVRASISSAYR
jgi:hypothetical protein